MDALKLNDSASEILQKFVVFFYEKLKLLFPFFISSLYRHRSGHSLGENKVLFCYLKNMTNIESFFQVISSSRNLFKSYRVCMILFATSIKKNFVY